MKYGHFGYSTSRIRPVVAEKQHIQEMTYLVILMVAAQYAMQGDHKISSSCKLPAWQPHHFFHSIVIGGDSSSTSNAQFVLGTLLGAAMCLLGAAHGR